MLYVVYLYCIDNVTFFEIFYTLWSNIIITNDNTEEFNIVHKPSTKLLPGPLTVIINAAFGRTVQRSNGPRNRTLEANQCCDFIHL